MFSWLHQPAIDGLTTSLDRVQFLHRNCTVFTHTLQFEHLNCLNSEWFSIRSGVIGVSTCLTCPPHCQRMHSTGRARVFVSISCGPGSMPLHRFHNLIRLMIVLQLVLPSGAPWLHTVIDDHCCAKTTASGEPNHAHRCHHHHHGADEHWADEGKSHREPCSASQNRNSLTEKPDCSHDQSDPDHGPFPFHNCSRCSICQAIAAPGVLPILIGVCIPAERIELLPRRDIGAPVSCDLRSPQCRAPPAVS
jgi:hypothetical protein